MLHPNSKQNFFWPSVIYTVHAKPILNKFSLEIGGEGGKSLDFSIFVWHKHSHPDCFQVISKMSLNIEFQRNA